MIPVLFKKDEQQFRTYGLGELSDFIDTPEVKRERNGQYTFYMKYSSNGVLVNKLEEGMKIKSDAGARTKWQTFEINRVIRKTGQPIEVFAKHISMRTAKDALKPHVKGSNLNGQQLLQLWRNNLVGGDHWEIWSDITTQVNVDWSIEDFSNALEVLAGREGSILDRIGGEYEFDNRTIRLWKQMGRTAPTVLEYGRNIVSVEKDNQEDSVYTSVYPYAVYTPENRDAVEIITLPEIYIDSEYIDMYDHRKVQVVDFTTEFDFDNPPTVARLRTLTTQYLKNNEVGSPWENVRVEYQDLSKTLDYQDFKVMEEVELNDVVPVFYPKFNIMNNNAKVVVTVYDPVKEDYKYIELGVIGQRLRSVLNNNLVERLNRVEKEQKQQHTYILNSSGNRVWYSTPVENTEHKIGDIWFEENGQYTRIRVWNGSQWIVEIDNEDVAKVEAEIIKAQEDIQDAKDAADAANHQINDAIQNAGFTSLTELTSDLKSSTNNAQLAADAAKADAISALSIAAGAKYDAIEAVAKAQNALDNIDTLDENINIEITRIDGELSSKVSQTLFNTLSGTVTSQGTLISQNQTDIALKANQSEVDTINGKVANNEAAITVNANEIALKASQTDVNALTGRVSTAESSITTNANAIALKASQTDVNTLTGEVSTINSELSVLSGEISSKVSSTQMEQAVDGIEIGGRNLLLDSDSLTIYPRTGTVEYLSDYRGVTNVTKITNPANAMYANPAEILSEPLKEGQTYTLSALFTYVGTKGSRNQFYLSGQAGGYHIIQGNPEENKFKRVYITVTPGANPSHRIHLSFLGYEEIYLSKWKLEKGSKATDWTPAPEDTIALIDHVESEWKQTAEGFTQSISSIDGRVTQQNQDINSITTRVGDAEGNISSVQQTVSGLQTTVASKASQTEVTQLANAVSLKVSSSDVEQILDSDKRIKDTRDDDETPSWYYSNYSRQTVREFKRRVTLGLPSVENYVILITEVPWSDTSGGHVKQTAYMTDKTYQRSGNASTWSAWQEIPHKSYVDSQISILSDAINLRVSKGDVVSQINVEAGRTLIQSNRLYLDAQSVVFSGNAFIPSAAISSLSADKLTAGTINAAEINVVGLNVNDITGLNAEFVRARFNESASSLDLDGTGMNIRRNDGSTNAKLGVNGIEFWINGSQHGMIGARNYTGTESYLVGRRSVSLFARNNSYVGLSYEGTSGSSPEGEGHIALSVLGSSGNIRAHNTMYFGRDYNAQINPTSDGNLNISGESYVALGYRRNGNWERILDVRNGGLRMYDLINMNTNSIAGVDTIFFTGTQQDRIVGNAGALHVSGLDRVSLGIRREGILDRIVDVLPGGMRMNYQINMNSNSIVNTDRVSFTGSANNRIINDTASSLAITAVDFVTMGIRREGITTAIMDVRNGGMRMYASINMQGYNINNQSDERLKMDIVDDEIDSLEAISSWRIAGFNWIDEAYPEERQFGLIAQSAPEISDLGEDGYLSINSTKQLNMVTHGLQQLNNRHENTLKVASHAYILSEKHEDELEELRNKCKELEERIESLGGVA